MSEDISIEPTREQLIKQLKSEVQKIQQQNIEKVNGLAGFGRKIDRNFLANLKLDVFIELVLDEPSKLRYVLALEQRLQTELNTALAEARRQALTKPAAADLLLPR